MLFITNNLWIFYFVFLIAINLSCDKGYNCTFVDSKYAEEGCMIIHSNTYHSPYPSSSYFDTITNVNSRIHLTTIESLCKNGITTGTYSICSAELIVEVEEPADLDSISLTLTQSGATPISFFSEDIIVDNNCSFNVLLVPKSNTLSILDCAESEIEMIISIYSRRPTDLSVLSHKIGAKQ